MAQIFLNSFGQNGTLVMWSFIILAQYTMGYFVAARFAAPDLRLVCSYYV
jgi:hypothetical protein